MKSIVRLRQKSCQAGTTPGGGLRFSRTLHWFRPETHSGLTRVRSYAEWYIGTQPAKYGVDTSRLECRAAPSAGSGLHKVAIY